MNAIKLFLFRESLSLGRGFVRTQRSPAGSDPAYIFSKPALNALDYFNVLDCAWQPHDTVQLTLIGSPLAPVADWPAGKPGDFPVAPASRGFSGPQTYMRIYFIDNQLTKSAGRLSIRRSTGHDVRRASPSERTTVMNLIHSPAGYRLPETKLFVMRMKKPHCHFYSHK